MRIVRATVFLLMGKSVSSAANARCNRRAPATHTIQPRHERGRS